MDSDLSGLSPGFGLDPGSTGSSGARALPGGLQPAHRCARTPGQEVRRGPVAIGVTNKGGLVEVLTTGDGNTWTIIVSMPNGTSCMVAAGEGWRSMERDDSKLAPAT